MAPEKVTEMVLNVDLKCSGCYKKVKKVICKIPQIRDQVFDVDKNKVKIMVVCCSPEKIRDKLCYKGGGAIQSIEIIEKSDKPKDADKPKPAAVDKPKDPKPAAPKPKEPEKPKPASDKPKDAGKPKEPEKPKPASDKPKDAGKPKEPEKPKPVEKPKEPKQADKPKELAKPPEAEKAKPKDVEKPKEAGPPKKPDADVAKMVYEPVHGYPQMYPTPAYPMVGYGQYFNQGYGGSPFEHGYGTPVAPPIYGGFGYEYGHNGNISHYSSNDHGGEDDEEGCSIM